MVRAGREEEQDAAPGTGSLLAHLLVGLLIYLQGVIVR